jgi:hypothetical protein
MEPLGKAFIRGFDIPADEPAGRARRSVSLSAKTALFPRDQATDSQEDHERYVFTHGSYEPGEQMRRNYAYPSEVQRQSFAFGQPHERTKGGAKDALVWDRFETPTTIALKRLEDFRQVARDHLGKSKNTLRHAPHDLRFGIRSTSSSNTTAQCLHFNVKDAAELVPDADLGRARISQRQDAAKTPTSNKVFGVPSVRHDIAKPERRGLADVQNYGDDPGAGALLNPQRFENMGVFDEDFLKPLTKDALRSLLSTLPQSDFDRAWLGCCPRNDDGTTSVQSFLEAYGREVVSQGIRSLEDLE